MIGLITSDRGLITSGRFKQFPANLPIGESLLAHLSRRLIGELIVYPWPGVRRRPSSVVVRRPQCSNTFFLETAWPIKAKFYVEPPWVGGTKFYSRHLSHMTMMAATPIYVFNIYWRGGHLIKNFLLNNRRADFHET